MDSNSPLKKFLRRVSSRRHNNIKKHKYNKHRTRRRGRGKSIKNNRRKQMSLKKYKK